jgi:hypothetical protein
VWSTQVKGANSSLLGAVDKIPATAITIQNGTFPWGRFLYNVFKPSTASSATKGYVGEEGWICKPAFPVGGVTNFNGHATNPITHNNFQTDIQNAIKAAGFVPLSKGTIGGGDNNQDYCRLTTT